MNLQFFLYQVGRFIVVTMGDGFTATAMPVTAQNRVSLAITTNNILDTLAVVRTPQQR